MKHPTTVLAFFSTALLASTTTLAQPSTSAAPAPQTHDWNDVSHINGQVVPVGETSSYLKDFRRANVSTNPVGLLVGFYGLSGSYAINDHIAIRGDANYFRPIDTNTVGFELGVGVPIYLRRTYQGAFIEPGLIVRETHVEYDEDQCPSCGDGSEVTFGPQALVGWHWTWDSGLNVAVAAGAGRNLVDDEEEYDIDDDLFFNGYFRVGYAF